jgi:plastocyanin domain-containing protein
MECEASELKRVPSGILTANFRWLRLDAAFAQGAFFMFAIMIAALLAAAPESAAKPSAGGDASLPARTIKLTVTKKGFQPEKIAVKQGQPLHLLVTRKTEETCATEIEIQDTTISQDLPLNKEVAVDYTPTKTGEIRYACSMGMVGGVLVVQ